MPKKAKPSKENNLEEVRVGEALSIADLVKLSGISRSTVSLVENGHDPSLVTKRKLLRGINNNPDRSREFILTDIFPESD